ncbi:MAG: hypothetical protein Q7U78_06015 [Gallionella sp.]|nr:hypothetical protein [Gallionella sp.]
MSREQYIALCVIGAVAVLAYYEASRVAIALRSMTTASRAGGIVGGHRLSGYLLYAGGDFSA